MKAIIFGLILLISFSAISQPSNNSGAVESGTGFSIIGLALKQNLKNQLGTSNASVGGIPCMMASYLREADDYIAAGPVFSYESVSVTDNQTGRFFGLDFFNAGLRVKCFLSKPAKTRWYFVFRPSYQFYSLSSNANISQASNTKIKSFNSFTAQLATGIMFRLVNNWNLQFEAAIGRPYFIAAHVVYLFPRFSSPDAPSRPINKLEQQF